MTDHRLLGLEHEILFFLCGKAALARRSARDTGEKEEERPESERTSISSRSDGSDEAAEARASSWRLISAKLALRSR